MIIKKYIQTCSQQLSFSKQLIYFDSFHNVVNMAKEICITNDRTHKIGDKNFHTIICIVIFVLYQCIFFFYIDEILFGSFLHNYCLMVRSGRIFEVINDWHMWRKYFSEASKHHTFNDTSSLSSVGGINKISPLADNIIAFLGSFFHLFYADYKLHDNILNYDAREDMGRYGDNCQALHRTFYQGSCPSCFAFALASALGARFCLIGNQQRMPSPYRIFDCSGNACKNSDKGLNAVKIMSVMRGGVSDIRESPPIFGWGCQRGTIRSKGFKEVCGISWIKREIILNGPIIMAADLVKLKSKMLHFEEWKEFYDDESNLLNGGGTDEYDNKKAFHALMVLGWSMHPEPHWIIKNSWGDSWGRLGMGRVPWTRHDCAFSFEPLIQNIN